MSMQIPDYSQLFHQSSKDLHKGHPPIVENSDNWPLEWKTTYYKTYPRLPKVPLEGTIPNVDLFDVINRRNSARDFSGEPLTIADLSIILKYSCGSISHPAEKHERRAQASGGARFPLEVYPLVLKSSLDLKAGVYHYNVKEHALDTLQLIDFDERVLRNLFTYSWTANVAVVFIITSVFWRNQNKYGERGYRYILHEAGHVGQNIYLTSASIGIKCCALGGTWDQNIENLIDIDGVSESLVYAVAVGR